MTEPMHGIGCCCMYQYYKWIVAANSGLLQTCAVRMPHHSDDVEKKQAYALEGNLEQTVNCIHNAQTLNWGSDFVKGPDFHFLNAGKTLN
jgi:glycerol kinase